MGVVYKYAGATVIFKRQSENNKCVCTRVRAYVRMRLWVRACWRVCVCVCMRNGGGCGSYVCMRACVHTCVLACVCGGMSGYTFVCVSVYGRRSGHVRVSGGGFFLLFKTLSEDS